MAFPPEFLDEIRARIPVSDVTGRRVALKRRGREHVGLSPFKAEKTPSFTVNDEKGFYHCFSTGEHGDVFTFLMKTEGLSFPEAVERLATQAGLEVPRESPQARERAERRKSLYDVVEAAAAYFEECLWGPRGRAARDYLIGRGLDEAVIRRFRLGYAPEGGMLRRALKDQGIEDGALIEAGLLRRPDDGREPYAFFRDRVMFPITDRRGRAIAFGGRLMGDAKAAKYINSPDTPLFDKGRNLYNLANARLVAHDKGRLIAAEGYMDVIALTRGGLPESVAPLGTALTEAQIEAMWRLAPEPIVCFDGDEAGRRAAFRAVERVMPILRPGASLQFAMLPEGDDPDSLLASSGAGALSALIDRARPLGDLLWEMEIGGRPTDTPERRANIRKNLLEQVRRIADRTVQQYYFDDMEARLFAAFRRQSSPRGKGRARGALPGAGRLQSQGNINALSGKWEPAFLASLLRHPELLDAFAEDLGLRRFGWPELDKLRQEIINVSGSGLDSTALQRHLKETGFSSLLDRILGRDVYEAAPFCDPRKTLDEVRNDWRAAWDSYWRRDARAELDEDARALGEDMTAERWSRLAAKKREIQRIGPDDQEQEREAFARPETG
ncbi:MAG: DNA primase [Rhodospirillaceae bacterium]|jgi:DNA primase|nr:DNA primase [Rhodospirillaceae bacterium]MBT6117394.1 DNA primase [Rhodospirillaceae bacterium]